MPSPLPIDPGIRHHFVGVAGSGMLPLALMLARQGCPVSGCDRGIDAGMVSAETLALLRSHDVVLYAEDGSGASCENPVIVRSTAVEDHVADIQVARDRELTVFSRGAFLAGLFNHCRGIGVAGSSGKTTTAVMIVHLLSGTGSDPYAVIGGEPVDGPDMIHGYRCGTSDWFCAEVDESDKSIEHFNPEIGLVTNISRDHFDIPCLEGLFSDYLTRTGRVRIAARTDAPGLMVDDVPWQVDDISDHTDGIRFRLNGRPVRLPVFGRHNALNAAFAVAAAVAVGIPVEQCVRRLAAFKGVRRRMEVIARTGAATVIDDFAHNPAKIRAAIEATRPLSRSGRIVAVFQPHGFGPLKFQFDDLRHAFSGSLSSHDLAVVLPVFYAGGTVQPDVASKDLAVEINRAGVPAECLDREALADRIRDFVASGDALIIMGARDPSLPGFVRQLAGCLE